MKTNIEVIKKEYNVDVKNRVVVCKLLCDLHLEKFNNTYFSNDFCIWSKQFPKINCAGMFTVKGKAICNKDDNFDEVLGKRIAESKAKEKMFNIAARVWKVRHEFFSKLSELSNNMITACTSAGERESMHIDELIL